MYFGLPLTFLPISDVGFLHDSGDYRTKQPIVYDLQEPFRWMADVTVVEAFESGVLDLPDFYFTADDYRYRFETETKRRFLDLLRERFTTSVKYENRILKWDTVIRHKAVELGRYLVGRSDRLDFSKPSPKFTPIGDQNLRKQILGLSHSDAKKRAIGKTTLHYLKKRARNMRALRIFAPVLERLRK